MEKDNLSKRAQSEDLGFMNGSEKYDLGQW
jgi:hypothetical protein